MGRVPIADVSELLLRLGLSSTVSDEEEAVAAQSLIEAEGAVKRYLRYDPTNQSRTEFYPQDDSARIGRVSVWEADDTIAYERFLSSASTDELQLRHLPVRSISYLYIDLDAKSGTQSESFAASSLKTEGTDFWANYAILDSSGNKLCWDGILRSMGRWPNMAGTVKVVYTAGYTSSELHGQDSVIDASPILDAVLGEALRRFLKMQQLKKKTGVGFTAGPLTSEKLGDYSYSVDATAAKELIGLSKDLTGESKEMLSDFVNYGWSI